MPKVYNIKYNDYPEDAIYVGRPSKWGNPYKIGKDGNREDVLAFYEQWFVCDPDSPKEDIEELRGKDLICHCAPERCHADYLLEIANKVYLTKELT